MYTYKDLAPHYGVKEDMAMCKSCFPVLSFFQLLDSILVKEGLHMTIASVAPDGGGPPTVEMQR